MPYPKYVIISLVCQYFESDSLGFEKEKADFSSVKSHEKILRL